MGNTILNRSKTSKSNAFYESIVQKTRTNIYYQSSNRSKAQKNIIKLLEDRIAYLLEDIYKKVIRAIETSASLGYDSSFVLDCFLGTGTVEILDINEINELKANDILGDPVSRNLKIHYLNYVFDQNDICKLPTVSTVIAYLQARLSSKFEILKSTNNVINGRSCIRIIVKWDIHSERSI